LAIGSLRAGYRLPAFAFFFEPARDEPAFRELLDFAREPEPLDFRVPELDLLGEPVFEPLERDLPPPEPEPERPERDPEPPDVDPELLEPPPPCSESVTGGSGGCERGSMNLVSSSVDANRGGGSR
jgi:hypothetical protein